MTRESSRVRSAVGKQQSTRANSDMVYCNLTSTHDTKKEAIKTWNTRKPMERIVERLEQQKQQYKRRSEEAAHVLQGEHFFGKMCSYDHAIEIVKGGGVDE